MVLATGFAPREFLDPMKVFGRDGRELSDEWRDGARAHLGITVPGFPNLFLVHGPNTALRAGSVVHMIECQAGYVRQAIGRLASGARTLAVRPEVADAFDRGDAGAARSRTCAQRHRLAGHDARVRAPHRALRRRRVPRHLTPASHPTTTDATSPAEECP